MNTSLQALAVLGSIVAGSLGFPTCPLDPATPELDDRTCYVSVTNGNDANSGTSGSPLKTIRRALLLINSSAERQTVRVLPGIYEECLWLAGGYYLGGVDIVADDFLTRGSNTTTIVDGTKVCMPAQAPVFHLEGKSSLRGFTIKGGGSSGVWAVGRVTISDNVITDNVGYYGAGIHLLTGENVSELGNEALIENNSIRDNTATGSGGGILVRAVGAGLPSNVVIRANTISGNVAGDGNGGASGGGITVVTDTAEDTDRSTVVITNNTIEENEAKGRDLQYASYGGGMYVSTAGPGTQTIEVKSTNVVRNNKATHGYGGGILARGLGVFPGNIDHSLLVESNSVTGNSAEFAGGGVHALVLALNLDATDKVVVKILSNDVAGNQVTSAADLGFPTGGGGISAEVYSEQTIVPNNALIVAGNSLRNNTSQSFGGGAALWVRNFGEWGPEPPEPESSRLRFSNNLVTGNRAEDTQTGSLGEGGGAYLRAEGRLNGSLEIDFKFNTVAGNTANVGMAGGVAVIADPTVPASPSIDVSNSIFVANSGFAVGGTANPGAVRIAFNDTFDNGAGPFAPQYTATAGPGNLTVDPELDAFFVPQLCSPTVDAGDPAEGTRTGDGGLQEERQPNGSLANLGHTGLTLNSIITLPDASGDAIVDGADILRLATSFASVSSDVGRYNPAADVDKDDDIDGSDLSYMSAWFGAACP